MKELLKSYYQFSDYQIAQLGYFFKTIFSEISKLLIMGFIFRNELDVYCIAILALCLLRTATGGLHCKTYLSCLLASTTYMFLALKILPMIPVNLILKVVLLLLCAPINYLVGPVTSDVHMPLTDSVKKKGQIQSVIAIIFISIVTFLIPKNPYAISVFWTTIIHTLQLIVAKIRKLWKGGLCYETEAH